MRRPPPSTLCPFLTVAGRDEAGGGAARGGLHWMLPPPLVPPLASVPLVSEDSALLRELRLASDGRASRRGGILSLMRSRPLASSKLVILCCGEKPLMAVEETGEETQSGRVLDRDERRHAHIQPLISRRSETPAEASLLVRIPEDLRGMVSHLGS